MAFHGNFIKNTMGGHESEALGWLDLKNQSSSNEGLSEATYIVNIAFNVKPAIQNLYKTSSEVYHYTSFII